MANPQIENGYIKIANELYGALARVRIPGEAEQVLKVIIRQTYGFNQKHARITNSQFSIATGIIRPHITRALNILFSMNLITQKGNNIYGLEKNFDIWKPLPKKVTVTIIGNNRTQKGNEITQKGNALFKDTYKDIYKDIETVVSYLNQKTGKNYSPKSKALLKGLYGRLGEGHTVAECKAVIDNRIGAWKGSDMEKYLTPDTIFRASKFPKYLAEIKDIRSEQEQNQEFNNKVKKAIENRK